MKSTILLSLGVLLGAFALYCVWCLWLGPKVSAEAKSLKNSADAEAKELGMWSRGILVRLHFIPPDK